METPEYFTPSCSPDHQIEPLPEESGHTEGESSSSSSTDNDSSSTDNDAEIPPFDEETGHAQAKAAKANFWNGNQHSYYRTLREAANSGDWETAKRFIDRDPTALMARITTFAETVLLVAARACQWEFILRLVELLPTEALAIQDIDGGTVLHNVAAGGNLRTVKALVKKNSDLPNKPDISGMLPVSYSLDINPRKEVVWYLLLVTGEEHFTSTDTRASGHICYCLCREGFHDITLYLLHRYPDLVYIEYPEDSPLLSMLLDIPSNFLSGSRLTFWERWIYQAVHVEVKTGPPESIIAHVYGLSGNTESLPSKVLQQLKLLLWRAIGSLKLVQCIRNVVQLKFRHIYANEVAKHLCKEAYDKNFNQIFDFMHGVLYEAVEVGVVEVLQVCTDYFPDLILWSSEEKYTLFHTAILQRQEMMFEFFMNQLPIFIRHHLGCLDKEDNTTLHIGAKLPNSSILTSIPGAALQMQRELQWFKALQKLYAPTNNRKNIDDKTAMEVFTDSHKELVKEGEKWMKNTSNSGMLVSTLIATVVFAAAFTVPGGNASNTGSPIFLKENSFVVFVISESLALFSSITSILMFLSVLTARYTQDDFLFSLPNKIIIGLGSLFLAIVSMMSAFGSTLYIVLNGRWRWVSFPIVVLGTFPVTLFVILQLPLFVQMVKSTYGGGVLGNKKLREFHKKLE